jgi:hypothetical protein
MGQNEEERDFPDMPEDEVVTNDFDAGGAENESVGEMEGKGSETPSPQVDIGSFLHEAWDLIVKNPTLTILGYLVVSLLFALSGMFIIGPLVLLGPLAFGYIRAVQKRFEGEPAPFDSIFLGFHSFSKAFVTGLLIILIGLAIGIALAVPAILLNFIPCIGTLLSLVLIAAGGLFTHAFLFFAFPIAALTDNSPTESIRASACFCKTHLWPVVLLALVTQIISSVGTVACGVGWILTTPIAIVMGLVAYNRYYLSNRDDGETDVA